MHADYIMYSPFIGRNAYVDNMERCWGSMYKVIPVTGVTKKEIITLIRTKAVVLNWVENELDSIWRRRLLSYKLLGIKIIWVFHNRIPHEVGQDGQAAVTARKNIKFLAEMSDAIIIHSQNSRKYLEEYTNRFQKVFYVPHVNYMRQYRWLNGSEDGARDFTFVFQGRIMPYKNIELLIKVYKDLELPNCRLRIVGEPCSEKYAEKIQALCAGTGIQLKLDYLSDRAVGEELLKGDVEVFPYDLKSSMNSGAMIGAFSCRRTVIVPNNAMAKDYKDEDFLYVYDYTTEAEHYENLKNVMRKAYENGVGDNRAKGIKAFEYTMLHNSDEAVIKELKKIVAYI